MTANDHIPDFAPVGELDDDYTVVLPSSDIRSRLAEVWDRVQEHGGPLVITFSGRPEWVIFPLNVTVRMVNKHLVMAWAREQYKAVTDKETPDHLAWRMPEVGPDKFRRDMIVTRRSLRHDMSPALYTKYGQGVGVLFVVPIDAGFYFVRDITMQIYPHRIDIDDEA